MGKTLNPKIIRELKNLEEDSEIRKSALTALKSLIQKLDTKTIPLFLTHVTGCKEIRSSSSAECIISLLEVLARVHGRNVVPHIDSIMAIITQTLFLSSGTFTLYQACSKVIPAIARYGIASSMPDVEKTRIICSLCKPLSDCLMHMQENAASGAALCLESLVQSDNWRFASSEMVNEVCLKVAGALEEKQAHLGLVMALFKHNILIAEAYCRSLIRSGLQILTTDVKEVTSQRRLSTIQMINFLMKSVDSTSISSEFSNVIVVLKKYQKDRMAYISRAALEAIQTAKMMSGRKGAKQMTVSNPLVGSNFDSRTDVSSSTHSEEHDTLGSCSGFPSSELHSVNSSLDYDNLVGSPLSLWQHSQDSQYMRQRRLSNDNSSPIDIVSEDDCSMTAVSVTGESAIHVEHSTYGAVNESRDKHSEELYDVDQLSPRCPTGAATPRSQELVHSQWSSGDADADALERIDGKLSIRQISINDNCSDPREALDVLGSSCRFDVEETNSSESIQKLKVEQQIQDSHLATNVPELTSSTCDAEVTETEGSKLSKFSVFVDDISLNSIEALAVQDSSVNIDEERKKAESIQKLNDQPHIQDTHLASNATKLISSTCDPEAGDRGGSELSKFQVLTDGISLDPTGALDVQNATNNTHVEEKKNLESIQEVNNQQKIQDINLGTDATEFITSICDAEVVDREDNRLSKFPDFTPEGALDVQDFSCDFDAEERKISEDIQTLNDQLKIQDSNLATDATELISFTCNAEVADREGSKLSELQILNGICSDPTGASDVVVKFKERKRLKSMPMLNTHLATDATELASSAGNAEFLNKDGSEPPKSDLTGPLDVEDPSCISEVKETNNAGSTQVLDNRQHIQNDRLATDTTQLATSACIAEVLRREDSEQFTCQVFVGDVPSDRIDASLVEDPSCNLIVKVEERKNSETVQELNNQQEIQNTQLAMDNTAQLVSPNNDAEVLDREDSMVSNEKDSLSNLIFENQEGGNSQQFIQETVLDTGGTVSVLSASNSNGGDARKKLSETSCEVKAVSTHSICKRKVPCHKQALSYMCCVFVVLLAIVLIPWQMEDNELFEMVPT